jgi:hypothetical protein
MKRLSEFSFGDPLAAINKNRASSSSRAPATNETDDLQKPPRVPGFAPGDSRRRLLSDSLHAQQPFEPPQQPFDPQFLPFHGKYIAT